MEVSLTATRRTRLLSDAQDCRAGPDMDGVGEYTGNDDETNQGFHFCGDENIPTKPYCIEHYKQAYNVDEKYLDRLLDFLHDKTKN